MIFKSFYVILVEVVGFGGKKVFDNSLKNEKHTSSNKDYDLKQILFKEGKVDKSFLVKLNHLKLEELISLKLDSAAQGLNGKLFNFPIWKFTTDIAKEAVTKYALSSTKSKKNAAMVMGITKSELNRLIKLYDIKLENKTN